MVHVVRVRCPACGWAFNVALPDGHAPLGGEWYQVTCPDNGSTFRFEAYRLPWRVVRKEEADSPEVTMAWPVADES